MAISRHYQRIAKRLRVFDLVGTSDDDLDFAVAPGDHAARGSERFLGFYSHEGVRRACEAYGIHDHLESLGLGSYEIKISRDDGSRHRMQVLLDGKLDDAHRVVDFMVRLVTVRAATITEGRSMDGSFDMLLVEWLCLQNPLGSFTEERPRLPGQVYPGLGLGYAAHNMSLIMAQRLGRHGVINVPEHFHLAVVYDRTGYDFVSRQHERDVDAATEGTRSLHFACAAWAAERGLIHETDEAGKPTDEVWKYRPAEMIVASSESFAEVVGSIRDSVRRFRQRCSVRRLVVDLDELRQSFIDDPVDGINPDRIL